jgi:1-acyl-sn-glycerol-3-phosphate acyltransferase
MNVIKKIAGTVYFFYGILLFVVTMLIVLIPVWLTTLFPEPTRAKLLHPIFKGWMSFFLPLVGCPVIRKGKEHFKKGENYVVVVNHNSLVDIPVSSPWIPGPNKTLAKTEMAKIPLFGVIYKAGSILVNRKQGKSRRDSFNAMTDMLSKGLHLCLYPEGTRNKTEAPLQNFYDGAFITAIRSQKPIIPGLIFNTKKIYPTDSKIWARPMAIHIHFLEPVSTADLTLNDTLELKQKVYKIMESYYAENDRKL